MDTPMPEAVKNIVVMNVNEVEQVASQVDFVLFFIRGHLSFTEKHFCFLSVLHEHVSL